MPLPFFTNSAASQLVNYEPIYSNLFDAKLYDKDVNIHICSAGIHSVSFHIHKDSESVVLKIYNDSSNPLYFDAVQELKYLSMNLHDKKDVTIQSSFFNLKFTRIEVTYSHNSIDTDSWIVEYEIESKEQLNAPVEIFIRDRKIKTIAS
jgi:hypothetical protein